MKALRYAPVRASHPLLAAALSLFPLAAPSPARAQAGAEAAAQAKQAADMAERMRGSATQDVAGGSVRSATPRTVSGGDARPARQPSGAAGSVLGYVVEQDTRARVPGVVLSLTSTEPEFATVVLLARTDSTGRYEFPRVEPGRWSLEPVADQFPRQFRTPAPRILTVARRDTVAVLPIELTTTACVRGRVAWADGYVLSDAPLQLTPADTSLAPIEGRGDGVGDFEICEAPAGPAMVWVVLRDGRRLGLPARLHRDRPAQVELRPEPLETMGGIALSLDLRTAGGEPVRRGEVVVVGRKLPAEGEPLVVFVRELVADAGGVAEIRLPYGVHEILAMNPREGQYGRREQFVVAPGAPPQVTHVLTLTGTSTPEQRAGWRQHLLDRAERFQRLWAQ